MSKHKWTDKDTAKRDGISIKEAKAAAHQARSDAGVRGNTRADVKEINNPPDWAPKDKLPTRFQ